MTEGPVLPRRRCAAFGWRSAAIAGAAATTGIVVLVALSAPPPDRPGFVVGDSAQLPIAAARDPLNTELVRCRALPANTEDSRCEVAWEVNRRRFMGESRSYAPPVEPPSIEPLPMNVADAAGNTATSIQSRER